MRRRRRRVRMLSRDAMGADDADVVNVSWIVVGIGVRGMVLVVVTGWSAHDTVASTAVTLNIDIVYGLDIRRVLIGRKVHPGEESCVTPRDGLQFG